MSKNDGVISAIDFAEKDHDYTSLQIIDLNDRTIRSWIICTDNPDPNSFYKKFFEG